jgi:hypothetical protein
VPRAGQETGLDLRVCGAPLRNRTVDLLLTMNHLRVQLVQAGALDQPEHEHTTSPHKLQMGPHERHLPLKLPLTLILTGKPGATETII